MTVCSCGNSFDGDNLCMPSACQWEDIPCLAPYGANPDLCYRQRGHKGPHSNKWGTTWARAAQWESRRA